MNAGHVNAAKFIARLLPEPHETDLGSEEAHGLLATAHADICCPPSGHRISWTDVYDGADMLPLTWKSDLFVDFRGEPRPLPRHLTAEQRQRALKARRAAVAIRREARQRNIH